MYAHLISSNYSSSFFGSYQILNCLSAVRSTLLVILPFSSVKSLNIFTGQIQYLASFIISSHLQLSYSFAACPYIFKNCYKNSSGFCQFISTYPLNPTFPHHAFRITYISLFLQTSVSRVVF